MAGKTTRKSVKVARPARATKAAAKRVAAKTATPPISASQSIDQHVRALGDWRGPVLNRMRELIHEADPEVVEEWKWRKATSPGTPVWSHDGGICTGESYRQVVKLTFFNGASLKDPARLFNSSLEGNTRRAIDIRKDDAIQEAAFKELIRAAVAFNVAKRKKSTPTRRCGCQCPNPSPVSWRWSTTSSSHDGDEGVGRDARAPAGAIRSRGSGRDPGSRSAWRSTGHRPDRQQSATGAPARARALTVRSRDDQGGSHVCSRSPSL
jgi:hypothetical protein